MKINRWSSMLAFATVVASTAVLLAAPPTPPKTTAGPTVAPGKPAISHPINILPTVPVIPDHPGVHINSVKIQGNCRTPATFVVQIQNNLTKVAQHGMVVVKAPNLATNHLNFDNLRPAEKRTLTIPTPWQLSCVLSEVGQPTCFEVSVVMEPDLTANGEVWDNVYHTVCANPPNPASNPAPLVTDRQHK